MATLIPKPQVVPEARRDGLDRMGDTLNSLAQLTGAITDELHKVYVTDLINPEREPGSESEDESYDSSEGSSGEEYSSEDENLEPRAPASRRRGSSMRRKQSKKAARATRKAKALAKKGIVLEPKKKRGVRKIKKLLSKGISSARSIGSRTSRTSKTKVTTSGSSNEHSGARSPDVVMNIDKVTEDIGKKRIWGAKLLPSMGRIPKTINADDASCSSVSVLEPPVKATSKSFDDVLDEFLVSSGISDLMKMFSSPEKKDEDGNEHVFCQDVGCLGKANELQFEDLDGDFVSDDEFYKRYNPDLPFDKPIAKAEKKDSPEALDWRTRNLESMLNVLATSELNTVKKTGEADHEEGNNTPGAEEPENTGMLSLAKSFDDLLHIISKVEIPAPIEITESDFKIQNSAPEECNSIASSEKGGAPLPMIATANATEVSPTDGTSPVASTLGATDTAPAEDPFARSRSLLDEDRQKAWKRLRVLKKLLSWKGASLSNFADIEACYGVSKAEELGSKPEEVTSKPEEAEAAQLQTKAKESEFEELEEKSEEAEPARKEGEGKTEEVELVELEEAAEEVQPDEGSCTDATNIVEAGNGDVESELLNDAVETRIRVLTTTPTEPLPEALASTTEDMAREIRPECTQETGIEGCAALEVDLAPDRSVLLLENGVPLNQSNEDEDSQIDEEQPNAFEVGLALDQSIVLLEDGAILDQLCKEEVDLKLNTDKGELDQEDTEEKKLEDLEDEATSPHASTIKLDEPSSERTRKESRKAMCSKESLCVAKATSSEDSSCVTKETSRKESLCVAKATSTKESLCVVSDEQPSKEEVKHSLSNKLAESVDNDEQFASGDPVLSLFKKFSQVRALRKRRVAEKSPSNRFSFIRSSKAKASKRNPDPPVKTDKPLSRRGMDPPLENDKSAAPKRTSRRIKNTGKQNNERRGREDPEPASPKPAEPEGNASNLAPMAPKHVKVGGAPIKGADPEPSVQTKAKPDTSQKRSKPKISNTSPQLTKTETPAKAASPLSPSLRIINSFELSSNLVAVDPPSPSRSVTDSDALTRSKSRDEGSLYGGVPLNDPTMATDSILSDLSELSATFKRGVHQSWSSASAGNRPKVGSSPVRPYSGGHFPKDSLSMMEKELDGRDEPTKWEEDFDSEFNKF